MVDLEQFREAVKCWRRSAAACGSSDDVKEADRLLSIIESAGKVEAHDVSEVTRQLIERDRRGRAKYGTSLDRTDLSISEWLQHMAEELLDGAGYALAAKRAVEQPWVVVDDAMAERAWRAGAAEYARINNGLLDDPGEDDIAAMRAALTAALSSAPGVESP